MAIDFKDRIFLPAGLQHCPINVKKVGKPFLFGHIMLAGKYSNDTPNSELFDYADKKTGKKPDAGDKK
jgi:hypothetical protein